MTFKFYRYLVVNFPVWFLLISPSVIFTYAASVDQINLEWELKFGECQLFNFTLEYTNKYMYNLIGLIVMVTSIFIQLFYLKEANYSERGTVYKNWRNAALLGIISVVLASLGMYCKIDGFNPLHFTNGELFWLLVAYVLMTFITYFREKPKEN